MTTEPKTPSAAIPEKHSSEDQNTSCSALFYLFQEVSKLASSDHNRFVDANSSSKWFVEASRKDPVEHKDEKMVNPCPTSKYLQTSLIPRFSCSQEKKMKMDNGTGRFHVLNQAKPHCESNSPWKVLSLINLQCKRLLHESDAQDFEPGLPSSTEAAVKGAPCDPQLAINGHFDNVIENCIEDRCRSHCCMKVGSGVVEDADSTVEASLKKQHGLKMVVSGNIDRQLEWSQKCRTSMLPTHIVSVQPDTQLTSNSHYQACVDLYTSTLNLDDNANVVLSSEPLPELPYSNSTVPAARPPLVVTKSIDKNCHSFTKQNDKVRACEPGRQRDTTDARSTSASMLDLSYSLSHTSTTTRDCTQSKEEPNLNPTSKWKTKTPRKQAHPCRSADSQDPDFQGVTFRMHTELDDTKEQCRLHITSKYSKDLWKTVRKPRVRRRPSHRFLKSSSSEEESELTANVLSVKVCASCCTRKTPMWRDAEDGTPLCNACGIRYKKYRVRCANCWHIPRKDSNSNSYCLKCGKCVKLTSAQKKRTS
ncbi:GATA-type zinc finger protein 1 [Gouania willdenowi]|uniref:GATA-type domain-containing protein n=1 Tax=Gouania willdenowi TaxID=441366 RepID=A0A8C5EJD0_GOUWI|nr:GATA-type zinc finger protein 1 [Gouania willdenowi]